MITEQQWRCSHLLGNGTCASIYINRRRVCSQCKLRWNLVDLMLFKRHLECTLVGCTAEVRKTMHFHGEDKYYMREFIQFLQNYAPDKITEYGVNEWDEWRRGAVL